MLDEHSCLRYFLASFMGCCVGGLAKLQSISSTSFTDNKKRKIDQLSSSRKRQWLSTPEAMENSVSISHSIETHISIAPTILSEENKSAAENVANCSFTNHGAIAWHEKRKEWVGDQSKRPNRQPREQIISWCTTYDDLLSTNQPFPQPILLSEMVDFLVDIWHEEGLYD